MRQCARCDHDARRGRILAVDAPNSAFRLWLGPIVKPVRGLGIKEASAGLANLNKKNPRLPGATTRSKPMQSQSQPISAYSDNTSEDRATAAILAKGAGSGCARLRAAPLANGWRHD